MRFMSPDRFHPAVASWFARTFEAPTSAQVEAWPAIQANRDVLIAAPTGSGKTLAAFLAAIDTLVREADEGAGALPDETRVIYVSPLKALSNDVQKNLLVPLAGIDAGLVADGRPEASIRAWVRTGDTPQHERASMSRRPPHILVTTPESLYILLGSASGRAMLATGRTVIVDEIHALVGNKRGAHLALTLERLDALAGRPLTRIGLSATQRPLDEVARFLVGAGRLRDDGDADCTVIDSGHVRARDLALEVPPTPLGAVMSGEQWDQVYDRIAQLVQEHRSTLVFVNTRRHAERAARQLSQRLGDANVAAHHGSLARERRLEAEQRLKRGELKALVATASLELGIDIGDVDLVCQLGSTRSINAFLQRAGRSGHGVRGLPKARLFPSTRDELVECTALLDAVRRGELDRLSIPRNALDVLAQQIVAEVACVEWDVDALYRLYRRAYPYRDLERADFDEVVRMVSEGYSTRRGRRAALVFHDAVHRRLRGRKGAKITAVTSGGTIPEVADYQVVLEPEGLTVGSVNEDFAVESIAGDVFQLGNTSYRILRVERSTVRVEDAKGQPPSIPFWLGEAPGRTAELSRAVSRLREEVARRLEARNGPRAVTDWLSDTVGLDESAATQLVAYLAAARAALGTLPTHDTIVLERFFDETGGMQLVVHSPYGSRINRAWGLALRKRFCRKFNFELQAAATEDCIVLSLTTAHSFELAEVARYLHSNTAREILIQALLAAPMFTTRFRWTASVALALPRFRGGRKVPPQIARMNAEDLLAAVFPEQVGCAENLPGDIPVPDHPLVRQTLHDCLEEAMDVAGFESLLRGLEAGTVRVVARDLTEPSPLAQEVLSARPYAYLDDAPLEERRTQAVMSRRWLDPEDAADLGRLDPAAIARVREEAWPEPTSPDEMHDALMWLGFLTDDEVAAGPGWEDCIRALVADGRVVASVDAARGPGAGVRWIAVERVPLWRALHPDSLAGIAVPAPYDRTWHAEDAGREFVRGRLQALGPTTAPALATSMQVLLDTVDTALAALESEGFVLRGQFEAATDDTRAVTQWCERRLLARIHRYTVKRLRAEIEPVQARDFVRFLFEWQGVASAARRQGPDAVPAVLNQLAGFDVPAGAWETEVLPGRIADYEPGWLDEHCLAGRYLWTRLAPRAVAAERTAAPVRATPIVLLPRRDARLWSSLVAPADTAGATANARAVAEFIHCHGAAFFDEIVEGAHLLPTQVEGALSELVALGLVVSDSFVGLRVLLLPVDRRRRTGGARRSRGRVALFGMEDAGRWSLVHRGVRRPAEEATSRPGAEVAVEHVARVLLQRWGVVFWKLYQREADWLPPWRELLMVYRRLEARGEIRGGRFVAGFAGEQYALPAAIGALRESRRRSAEQEWISISAADPLNVVGLLTPGARVPALTGNRVLYHDGVPVAALSGGEVCYYEEYDEATQWVVRNRLLRRPGARAGTSLGTIASQSRVHTPGRQRQEESDGQRRM
ncbi:MAG TPA: DEAD/DEAH box helicase [Steroidobacteraceae bacterium]|nr:DEAD/DEAH box helicase [Steroidobacteraceae bacterium]